MGKLRELINWAMNEQIRRIKEESFNVTRKDLEKQDPALMEALDRIAKADVQTSNTQEDSEE